MTVGGGGRDAVVATGLFTPKGPNTGFEIDFGFGVVAGFCVCGVGTIPTAAGGDLAPAGIARGGLTGVFDNRRSSAVVGTVSRRARGDTTEATGFVGTTSVVEGSSIAVGDDCDLFVRAPTAPGVDMDSVAVDVAVVPVGAAVFVFFVLSLFLRLIFCCFLQNSL